MTTPRNILAENILDLDECDCWKAADDIISRLWAAGYIIVSKELPIALEEMVEAHSMKNVGLNASKRRLDAIKKARQVSAKSLMPK